MTLESKIGYSHQWSNAYYQVNFWCGFCKKIIQADHDPRKPISPGKGADDNDASNHRWDHIGAHFDKEKLKMDQWVYWEHPEKIGNLKNVKFVRDSHDGKENPRKEERKREKLKERQMEERRMTQADVMLAGPNIGSKRKAGEDFAARRLGKKKKGSSVEPIFWNCVSLQTPSSSCFFTILTPSSPVRMRQRSHLHTEPRLVPREMRTPALRRLRGELCAGRRRGGGDYKGSL